MPEPWFASTLDGMTPIATSTPSTAGPSATSQRSISTTTAGLAGAISPVLPERLAGWAGCAFRNASTQVSEPTIELLGAALAPRVRLAKVSPNTNNLIYHFQYWNGSAWVTVGATIDYVNNNARHARFEWSGYGTSNGAVSVRIFNDAGESLVAERSASDLDFTGLSGIVQLRVTDPRAAQPSQFSSMFVCDANGDTSYVYTNVANANGADTGGTGDFNSVNTVTSTYDSSFISLPTAGLRRSIKNTANRAYNSRTVRAVNVAARLRRGASGPTRAAVYLTIGGTRYYHPNVQLLTTSFESYTFVWETNPATGVAWTTADAEAAALEWGVEARA